MLGPSKNLPTREQIEKRAFEIYVRRGCEKGSELANWAAAEKELMELSSEPETPLLAQNNSAGASNVEPKDMFLDFFGLREQPFGMTPDPAYLFASGTHRDALSALKFGIAENRGFFALVAQPGMGKTTLLYRLLEDLHDSARTVLVSQTQCNSRELMAYILQELGVAVDGMGLVSMHGKLNEILFEELLAGKRFVLVVDEAQNLDDTVLETVRMLSNFETHNAKLVQIILAGQPRLAAKLAQPKLTQLRQRIAVLSHLEPFTPQETSSYIAHRLAVAGHSGAPIFDSAALDEIARHSDGIPRNINNLCYNALLASFRCGLRTVTTEMVGKAVASLDLEALISRPAKAVDAVQPVAASTAFATESSAVAASIVTEISKPAPENFVPDIAQPVIPAMPLEIPERITDKSAETIAPPVAQLTSDLVSNSTPDLVPVPAIVAVSPIEPVSDPVAAPVSVSALNEPAKTISRPDRSQAQAASPASLRASTATPTHAPVTVPANKVRLTNGFISYEGGWKLNLKRWQIRSMIVTVILLSAILALAILGRSQSKRGINSHLFDSNSGALGPMLSTADPASASGNYDAAPMETNGGEILTVAAGTAQSIGDLSLRYVGHFDNDLFKQILALNPELKDPQHLQPGQLIRIPLPPGSIRKMNDTGEASAEETDKSVGLLSKFSGLFGGKKQGK